MGSIKNKTEVHYG